jgi:hypothetical protein
VEAVAGLTAVDGATLLTSDYALLAFGAKVARRRGAPPLDQIMVTEPIHGGVAEVMTPSQLGGTRHLAAGQFVQDQHDAIADLFLVAVRGPGPRASRRDAVVVTVRFRKASGCAMSGSTRNRAPQ